MFRWEITKTFVFWKKLELFRVHFHTFHKGPVKPQGFAKTGRVVEEQVKGLQKRGVWSKSNGRPLAWSVRRATGGPLAARACPWKDLFSLQHRVLANDPKWSVRWLWSNLHFTINYEQRMFSLSNVLTWCNLTCRNFGPVNHCSYFHSSTSFQVSILRFFILWTVTHTSHFLFSSSFSSIRFVILRTCKA